MTVSGLQVQGVENLEPLFSIPFMVVLTHRALRMRIPSTCRDAPIRIQMAPRFLNFLSEPIIPFNIARKFFSMILMRKPMTKDRYIMRFRSPCVGLTSCYTVSSLSNLIYYCLWNLIYYCLVRALALVSVRETLYDVNTKIYTGISLCRWVRKRTNRSAEMKKKFYVQSCTHHCQCWNFLHLSPFINVFRKFTKP